MSVFVLVRQLVHCPNSHFLTPDKENVALSLGSLCDVHKRAEPRRRDVQRSWTGLSSENAAFKGVAAESSRMVAASPLLV